eukprot:COSAG02_NODE_27934_length_600_cov_0.520958_1_plen_199_part_11
MAALGKEYTEKEFDELCFEFGIELDEVTSEAVMVRKEKGSAAAEKEQASEELIYKIDIPANRYDLLCIEGIARALRVYLGKEAVPVYRTLKPDTLITMTVSKETAQIRPYVVAAVLRNVKFTQQSYNSFIDLQVRDPTRRQFHRPAQRPFARSIRHTHTPSHHHTTTTTTTPLPTPPYVFLPVLFFPPTVVLSLSAYRL